MGRKLLKTVQTITTFQNPLADPVGTRRGPSLVRGPQFENRCPSHLSPQELLCSENDENRCTTGKVGLIAKCKLGIFS